MPQDAQCHVWDITAPADGVAVGDVHRCLRPLCKKYVFQLERGEEATDLHPEGYLHYQGRVSLFKKDRPAGAAATLSKSGLQCHVTPSSGNSLKGDAFYVMKQQTRVEGPFKDEDYADPPPKTRQVQVIEDNGLRPWQQSIKEIVEPYNDRHIHMVVDTTGNHGKSTFLEWMEYKGFAYEIPTMRLMEDIMQCCMSIAAQKCYMIDMPRAMKKDKLADFFSGIECLKNGVMYDKRYKFKKRRIERPQVVVYTNQMPNFSYLSSDRWKIYNIVEGCLVTV